MTFEPFTEDYILRLRAGDPIVGHHFSVYFGELIHIKLRRRIRNLELIEDVQQETLLRVLRKVREEGGLENPESLGSYVNTVCEHVVRERLRAENRYRELGNEDTERIDETADLDAALITAERKLWVTRVLAALPDGEGGLLREIFMEEGDRTKLCERLGINHNYLRVMVFRAKQHFLTLAGKRNFWSRFKEQ